MGSCASKSSTLIDDEKLSELRAQNKEIDKVIKSDSKNEQRTIRVLLLGAGESGKSTFLKQMKIIYSSGFSREDKQSFIPLIHSNIMEGILAVVMASQTLKVNIPKSESLALVAIRFPHEITETVKHQIQVFMQDENVKKLISERSSEFQISDGSIYFLKNIDRILDNRYVPLEQDILHSRNKTSGIIENSFIVQEANLTVIDVGGQRSERKKWIHCFQDITAIIFFVSLADYDLLLYEDSTTNRMIESLILFEEICNARWFSKSSFIVFFNKRDIFADKIAKSPLSNHIPLYTGKNNFNETACFIQNLFLSKNTTEKTIYPHLTCATDTDSITSVMTNVQETLFFNFYSTAGF